MRRLLVLVLVLLPAVVVPASSAPAATKIIKVKVELTDIAGDDLVGALRSQAGRCVKNRQMILSGDSTGETLTDESGGFGFDNLYKEGSWTVGVEQSKRFGPKGKRKRCAADTADYEYSPQEVAISFLYSPESGGTGVLSSPVDSCVSHMYLELYLDGSGVMAITNADSEGAYAFAPSSFAGDGGSFTTRVPYIVPLRPRKNGNLDIFECFGESAPVFVSD